MKPFYSDETNIERNVFMINPFLFSFNGYLNCNQVRLRRSICRQMYLEVLSWQGGGGQVNLTFLHFLKS